MATTNGSRKRTTKRAAKRTSSGMQHRAVCMDDSWSGPPRDDVEAARKDAAAHRARHRDHEVEVVSEFTDSAAGAAARDAADDGAFAPRTDRSPATSPGMSRVHLLGPGMVCDTEPRGFATQRGRKRAEIVVDATAGFIPLWAPRTILRWRFRDRSFARFADPVAAMAGTRRLFASALLAWGTASPVRFKEDADLWDFEIVMRRGDECDNEGCVLASAFFPDRGRHQLYIYPFLLEQTKREQVDTLVHEIGHVFGLRHFFAPLAESEDASEIFGTHSKFSIMNYGTLSRLTAADRDDLRRLYRRAWDGRLTEINGTPIRLVKPYSTRADAMVASGPAAIALRPKRAAVIGIG